MMMPVRRRRRRRRWPKILATVLIVMALGTVGFFAGRSLHLELTVPGPENLTQEYTAEYAPENPQALLKSSWLDSFSVPIPVEIMGQVQADRAGAYTLMYRAGFLWLSVSQTRSVQIVDTAAPTLELIEDTAGFTLPGHEYEEVGFFAYDDHDGDISRLVQKELYGNILVYTVADSSGNIATAFRELNFDDPVPPELTLNGSGEEMLCLGWPYEEPGYSALDNLDGDITDKVVVEGTVDVHTEGSYPITYTVTDTYGNTSTIVRTVTVQKGYQPEVVVPEEKVIYLTFDDGPSKHTPKLLDVLRKYGVKATFFVVNTTYADTITRIAEEGHAVGVHTGSHVYKTIYASEKAYFNDFASMHERIYELTGIRTTLMRFPGGSSNKVSSFNPGIMTRLTKLVTDYGLQYFDWNVNSMDAGYAKTADEVFQYVTSGIGDQHCAVVLQHDIYDFSVDAVERIIQWGIANGYQFLALDPTSPKCHQNILN